MKVLGYGAGPLFAPSARSVGAVAAADLKPRDWSEDDVSTLGDIARCGGAEIAAHANLARAERAERALQRKDKAAAEALERMDEGFYSLDRNWRLTYVNKTAEQFWGK